MLLNTVYIKLLTAVLLSVMFYVRSFAQTDDGFFIESEFSFGENLTPEPEISSEGFNNGLTQYVGGNYPRVAFVLTVSGTVYLSFNINEAGEPVDFEVISGIGAGCDSVAIDAVISQGLWHPGMEHGVTTKMPVQVEIEFSHEACKYKKLRRSELKLRKKYYRELRKLKGCENQCDNEKKILEKYVRKFYTLKSTSKNKS